MVHGHGCKKIAGGTRRCSESAYICQVNFLLLLYRVGEGDGAPLKPSVYLELFSK